MANVAVSNSQEHPVLDDAVVTEKMMIAFPQQEELEGKKKRILEELESALVPKDSVVPPIPKPNCLGFGIEVIDETALLDSIPKIGKQSRRRVSKKTHKKTDPVRNNSSSSSSGESENKKKKKKIYSRVDMEALRFVNVSQQRKFWKRIYDALQSTFTDEYDTLVAAPNNPLPFVPNMKPILTGVSAANGRCRYMNVFVH